MAEKITRTHEERDALLSKVFDSTLQTKDIEITQAGTTEITPDEGYFALKKVNLNVNVQGGSGGEGGGSTMEYLDLREYQDADFYLSLTILADVVNAYDADYNAYCGVNKEAIRSLFGVSNTTKITYNAVGIDLSRRVKANVQGQIMELTNIDLVTMTGANKEDIAAIPRITKEEFYAL